MVVVGLLMDPHVKKLSHSACCGEALRMHPASESKRRSDVAPLPILPAWGSSIERNPSVFHALQNTAPRASVKS